MHSPIIEQMVFFCTIVSVGSVLIYSDTVALSRARHGLYILGNASELSGQSSTWATVVDELTEQGALGNQLPIVCHRHPEEVGFISKPGDLPRLSPDGMIFSFHPDVCISSN